MENFEGILAQMTVIGHQQGCVYLMDEEGVFYCLGSLEEGAEEIMWTGCSVRFDPDMVEIKDEEMLFQCERMIGSGHEGDFVAGNL